MFGSSELDILSQEPPGIVVPPIFKALSETIRFWWFPMVGNCWLYNGMVSHQWLRSKASSVFATNHPTTRPPHLLLARPVLCSFYCREQLYTLVSQCLEKIPYFCKACCDRFVAAEGLVTKPAKYSRWWRNVSPAPPLMWCRCWFHPEEKTNFLHNSDSRRKFYGVYVSDWDRLKEAKPPWQRGRGRRGRWKIQSSFSYHHDNHSHD